MVATTVERELIAATESERIALAEIRARLARDDAGRFTLVAPDGETVALPEPAVRILRETLDTLANGQVVVLGQLPENLTLDQAAALLNVTRSYLEQLLDQGQLPFTTIHGRRRVPFLSLIVYRDERDARRRQGLDELARMSQELGLYGVDEEAPPAEDASSHPAR
jgi:excisionase family DNA binding protein